ncbi:MAG: TIGR04282 family arsenosugar biosynthesis glycosyltransferase, partial [Bacteroidota bacterium]
MAKVIGDQAALSVYTRLLTHTKEVVADLKSSVWVWYSDCVDDQDIWSDKSDQKYVQEGGSLGERMSHAFQMHFKELGGKAILIGSDCADLKHKHLEQALTLLDSNDVVLGPALDGGYYLIGMRSYIPELFT